MYRATFDQQNQQTAAQQVTYTAFGEPVVPDGAGGWTVGGELPIGMSRSGYAGGHGYESGMITLEGENSALPPITLLHVGERWYNPSTGRFVQRDPIGLRGGLNVYAYCGSQPMTAVDPSGCTSIVDWLVGVLGVGRNGWLLGKRCGSNVGILRYGWTWQRRSARRGVWRIALRVGQRHYYGWPGAWRLAGLFGLSVCVGAGVGTILDHAHPGTDRPWHEHIGEWLYWGRGEGEYSRQGNGEIILETVRHY